MAIPLFNRVLKPKIALVILALKNKNGEYRETGGCLGWRCDDKIVYVSATASEEFL